MLLKIEYQTIGPREECFDFQFLNLSLIYCHIHFNSKTVPYHASLPLSIIAVSITVGHSASTVDLVSGELSVVHVA